MRTTIALLLAATACTSIPEDAENDSVADGKADSAFSSFQLAGAVLAANTLTPEQLDDDAGLSARAAKNIAEHRRGADGVDGTADDDPFDDAAELDAVPYVGPVAFRALIDYARENKLVATDLAPLPRSLEADRDNFGNALLVSGDTLIVGAPSLLPPTGGVGVGGIHTYTRTATGWQTIGAPLLAQDVSSTDVANGFGAVLALDGTTLVVGGRKPSFNRAFLSDSMKNNPVFVLERSGTGWTPVATFTADTDTTGFGRSVAIGADVIAVAAPFHSSPRPCDGAVFLYARTGSTWALTTTLYSPSTRTCNGDGNFGLSVAMRGTTLVVASRSERDDAGVPVGAAYVYDVTTPSAAPVRLQPQGLGPISIDHGNHGDLGEQIAFDGDTIALGARGYGAVFVYKRSSNGWAYDERIQPTMKTDVTYDAQITSVAAYGNEVIVGVHSWNATRIGVVYRYTRIEGGYYRTEILRAPAAPTAYFGRTVAYDGAHLVVSAPGTEEYAWPSDPTVRGAIFSD